MGKFAKHFSLDKDVALWIDEKDNASAFANRLFRKEMEKEKGKISKEDLIDEIKHRRLQLNKIKVELANLEKVLKEIEDNESKDTKNV